MTNLMIATTILLLFPIREGLKDAFMIKDLGTGTDGKEKKTWHGIDLVWQIILIAALSMIASQGAQQQQAFIFAYITSAAFWFWAVQDEIINIIALHKPIGYLGTTSTIDKLMRELLGNNAGTILAFVKIGISFFAAAIAYAMY